MPKKKRMMILLWVCVLLWGTIIWGFSAQSGAVSQALSEGVSESMVGGLSDAGVARFHKLIRKVAHIAEYAILAGLLYAALVSGGAKHPVWMAASIALLAAASDELHQLFVADRSGRFTDVLIDMGGTAIGLSAAWLIRHCLKKRKA